MVVAFVDAVDSSSNGCPDVFVGKQKLAEARVQRKAVDPMARRIDHHRAGSINEVARSNLLDSLLKTIFKTAVGGMVRHPAVYRKYGSDAGVDIDVRGTVQRVEHQDILALLALAGYGNDVFRFFRRH